MRTASVIAAAVGAAIATLTVGAGPAGAGCQLQWQPDPFGGSGGSLHPVCDDPSAPTGSSDGSGGKQNKKKKPSFASIVVNMTTLNDDDTTFVGATSAGYAKKRLAVRKALRACRRDQPGLCESIVTARNGWAVLIVTAEADGSLVVFGDNDKVRESAFQEAERRARESFGGSTPNPIQRVRAVRSRAR
ncbi:MAG: hypothetical protein ACRDVF_18005 [Microbacterium sp.]|uniref:hypothetical protein n=1 Tax=Microbacterium sp. TaxID=51671 RepID=UPI003D6F29FC